PYMLGGFSFGGLVAFELARRLEQDGATVGLVALLDMECPVIDGRRIFGESMAYDDSTLLSNVSITLKKLYADHPEKRGEIDGLASQGLIGRVLDHLGVGDVWRENARRVFTILLHSSRALRDYVPRPYGGRVTVFRSTDSPGDAEYGQLLQPEHHQRDAML